MIGGIAAAGLWYLSKRQVSSAMPEIAPSSLLDWAKSTVSNILTPIKSVFQPQPPITLYPPDEPNVVPQGFYGKLFGVGTSPRKII